MKKPPDTLVSQALMLLPYLLAKGEVPLSQAANDLRLTGQDVEQLAHLLQFCGVPPYGGGDTFDCYVEGGTIRLATARGAPLRPARLTHREALALTVGAHFAARLVPSVARAAGRLREKLAVAASAPDGLQVPLQVEAEPPGVTMWLPLLRSAIQSRNVVRISYYSLNSARLAERSVEPWKLYYARGRWYLLAYCRLRRRDSVFRLDRVRQADVPGETFRARTRRAREPTPIYEAPALEVDIILPEGEARLLEERESPFLKGVEYGLPEGMARVRIVSDSLQWIVAFVLKYAGEAVVEGPENVRQAVVKAAQEILQRYREES